MEGRKTLGRRKIPIEKIEKKASRQVTFSKRRMGLFKKASELNILCGAEIAMLVESPGKKMFAFGIPSVDLVLDRFLALPVRNLSMAEIRAWENNQMQCAEVERRLEREKEMQKMIQEFGVGLWWEQEIEAKDLEELEGFLESMEELLGNVFRRLQDVVVKGETENIKLEDNNVAMLPPPPPLPSGYHQDEDDILGYPLANVDGRMMMNAVEGFVSNNGNSATCSSSYMVGAEASSARDGLQYYNHNNNM